MDGAGTLGNTISYNSITNNGAKGIELSNGSNNGIEPPTIEGYDGFSAYGRADPATAPAGSTVQVFSDPGGEGVQYLGETTVLAGGTWSAPVANPVFMMLTATVTDLQGSTSEFGGFLVDTGGLFVARTDGGTGSETAGVETRQGRVVLDLTLTPVNTDVLVTEIEFKAEGTLDDATQILAVRLYADRDDTGTVTELDDLLGGVDGQGFDADDGSLVVRLENGALANGRPERWLLVLDFAGEVRLGASFRVSIPSANAIAAGGTYPFVKATLGG